MPEALLDRIATAKAERLRSARAAILDMDGTLVLGNPDNGEHGALPGAMELLVLLRRRHIPFRVFTNGTAKPPHVYAAALRQAGLDVANNELMTPATAAAAWFLGRGIRRVRVLGLNGAQQPLRAVGLDVIGPGEQVAGVEAVFTGWYREFTFPHLELACRDVWAGALLTTASNVPFFAAKGGRAIGTSFAINAMIGSLTGKRARVLGKPARTALRCALRLMGLPVSAESHTLVVGDDPALELRMSNRAGAIGIGVTTGLSDRAAFASSPATDAAFLVSDLRSLVKVLR